MKNLIIKIATYAFLAGLVFSAMGVWQIIKERNVSVTPEKYTIDSLIEPKEDLMYVAIEGGRLDIMNTYELSLSTKKTDINLSSNYYTPVLNVEDSSVIYILKSDLEPSVKDIIKVAEYQGLLQSKNELPEKILTAYEKLLPGHKYFYLDSTYKPETLLEKIKGNAIFFYMLFGGLFVRLLLTRSPKQNTETAIEEENA